MKKYILLLFSFIFSLILCSCNSTDENYNSLVYKPGPPIKMKGYEPKESIFIDEIKDKRPKEKNVTFKINADPYILIPLWLWSHSYIDPVLRYSYFQEPLPLILKALIYSDIKASNLFKDVISSEELYEIKSKNSYRLEVSLKDATWSRNLTSYGLSYPGTILWAFGLPVSYGDVYIKIKAELFAPNSDKPLNSIEIFKTVPCTEWIYDQVNYSPPISEYKLAEMFPEVTKELRTFILKTLSKQN
jgi:hypothetical protein